MNRGLRVALLACASFVALAFSGTALAAYTPKLIVNHAPPNVSSSSTQIVIALSKDDDPTFKVTFYVPQGYSGVLGQAPGTQIGTVSAHIVAQQISKDAVLPINGVIKTDDPAKYTSNPASVGCAGPIQHSAVWLLSLEASGQTLNVPAYIDTVTGAEAQFAQFKVQACLASPDVPPAAGGAPLGAKLVDATLNLSNVFTTPVSQGQYIWPGIFTPYTPGKATVNVAGTVQARAVVRLPGQITLKGKITSKKRRTVLLSGAVTENLTGIVGAPVQLLIGSKVAFKTTAKAGGKYSFALRRKGKRATTIFRARAVVPARSLGAAGCSIDIPGLTPVPGGCVSATASAFTVTSGAVRVTL